MCTFFYKLLFNLQWMYVGSDEILQLNFDENIFLLKILYISSIWVTMRG